MIHEIHFTATVSLYLVCSGLCLLMGMLVLVRDPLAPANRAFAALTASAFVWQLGTHFVLAAPTDAAAELWSRFSYFGATFISLFTYLFVVSLLGLKRQSRWAIAGGVVMGAVFLPMLWSDLLLAGVSHYPWGRWYRAGPLHPVYLACFSAWMLLTFVTLAWAVRRAPKGVGRRHLRFLFGAFLVSYLAAVDFLPDYGVSVYPFGYLPVTLYLGAIAFAMTRYGLFSSASFNMISLALRWSRIRGQDR